jgi:hypothetical protein
MPKRKTEKSPKDLEEMDPVEIDAEEGGDAEEPEVEEQAEGEEESVSDSGEGEISEDELESLEDEGLGEELEGEEILEGLELTDDPVRMYLREIGQVNLLNSDQETWLAVQILTQRQVAALRDRVTALRPAGVKLTGAGLLYLEMYNDLCDDWKHLRETVKRLGQPMPDLGKLLQEARSLRTSWQEPGPSYLRTWLERGPWGRDPPGTRWRATRSTSLWCCMPCRPNPRPSSQPTCAPGKPRQPNARFNPGCRPRRSWNPNCTPWRSGKWKRTRR